MQSRREKGKFKIIRCMNCGRKTTGHHHSLCNNCHSKHPALIN